MQTQMKHTKEKYFNILINIILFKKILCSQLDRLLQSCCCCWLVESCDHHHVMHSACPLHQHRKDKDETDMLANEQNILNRMIMTILKW